MRSHKKKTQTDTSPADLTLAHIYQHQVERKNREGGLKRKYLRCAGKGTKKKKKRRSGAERHWQSIGSIDSITKRGEKMGICSPNSKELGGGYGGGKECREHRHLGSCQE